jgi:hypothetical protein
LFGYSISLSANLESFVIPTGAKRSGGSCSSARDGWTPPSLKELGIVDALPLYTRSISLVGLKAILVMTITSRLPRDTNNQ